MVLNVRHVRCALFFYLFYFFPFPFSNKSCLAGGNQCKCYPEVGEVSYPDPKGSVGTFYDILKEAREGILHWR